MPAHAIVWWVVLVALAVTLVAAGLQIVRAWREARRIAGRLDALADAPVFGAVERAEASLARIEAAVAAVPPLVARAGAAVEVMRRGPVPRGLVNAVRRLRTEVAAFRAFARR